MITMTIDAHCLCLCYETFNLTKEIISVRRDTITGTSHGFGLGSF